ncbi:hypothetical protein IFVP408_C290466 [Vibrio parahaemolyticus]
MTYHHKRKINFMWPVLEQKEIFILFPRKTSQNSRCNGL